MHALSTVRVVNPNAPDTFMLINESDLRDHHELWGTEPRDDAQPGAGLRACKGPGGRWFVKQGKDIVGGPFATEAEAEAAVRTSP